MKWLTCFKHVFIVSKKKKGETDEGDSEGGFEFYRNDVRKPDNSKKGKRMEKQPFRARNAREERERRVYISASFSKLNDLRYSDHDSDLRKKVLVWNTLKYAASCREAAWVSTPIRV
ncbi:uncharacterized protein LOC123317963 [Coccinella septempunctata]|uniref:uncharacterized protein LOC123317963 n=1 Tax=Coccinella septempunctata TaxID=41139 RepID=UPI001D08838A|nr:uncharacterized protein LOC123317963 [Coccinella septempunctata]